MPGHFFTGNYAPLDTECDIDALQVAGTLPPQLRGALYRVGPNPRFAPRDDHYHWFSGDGMVHAFFIDDGKVAYANRWARTPKWQLENDAGHALFGTFGNPATSDPSVHGKNSGTANTNMAWHGGRLFALEESHQPFEMDPHTLASKGHQDFDGAVNRRFTAHPKADPATGELHFFSYLPDSPGEPNMQYGVLDAHCRVTTSGVFRAPYASMMHDFMLTERHVLFPVTPLTISVERAMKGLPLFAWEAEKRSHVGIGVRGQAMDKLRWFASDACHVFHVMNAWDDGGRIVAYVMESRTAPGMPNADGSPGDPAGMAACLCRWTFDMESDGDSFERTILDDLAAEFPRIDERFSGRRNRVGFYCCHSVQRIRSGSESVLYDALACFDFASGTRQLYTLPAGDVVSEPVFVARSAQSPEGDGWLLAVAWRAKEGRSDLLVIDATDLAAGPVATVRLPHRIPFGFHGCWRASD
ncbi:carotenoid oxygenase family protein [Massilia sp. CCM 8734]|uniref:carotenoid oxygenase family protein n=1 Tax=Massilia sp. CCM 8734 TaxID=2609283 RepID=UPI0014239B57|nr:carotenoid oxygenase family protein [Massilia sp. CCM 8734]NIA00337.1 carotenoid oxygenase [Massilia sp. CCM 8734]